MEPSIQENGDEAGEGRETKETDPGSPRRCDIIIISGRKEKCEAAKEALEVCLPHSFSFLGGSDSARVAADRRSYHFSPKSASICSMPFFAAHTAQGGHFFSPGLRIL